MWAVIETYFVHPQLCTLLPSLKLVQRGEDSSLVEGKELAMTDPSPASVDAPVAFSSVELAISSSPDMDLDPDSVSVVVESLLSTPLAFSRVSFKAPQTELHCQSW